MTQTKMDSPRWRSLKVYFNFDFNKGRRLGHLVRNNDKTGWFKIMMGAKSYVIIKRHYVKHHITFNSVRLYGGDDNAALYTSSG